MKRALTIAVASALLATLLGGIASASESNDFVAAADTVALDTDRPDVDPQQILRRCRYLFGENELADITQERCRELWNRWCQAYPRTPQCRLDRPTDRPIDRPIDHPVDRPVDRPTVRPVEPPSTSGPVVGPPDKADLDRIRDRDSHDEDREGNGTHVRARLADL